MKEENKMNKNQIETDINYLISMVYELASNMGVSNPFDKYKFRLIIKIQ